MRVLKRLMINFIEYMVYYWTFIPFYCKELLMCSSKYTIEILLFEIKKILIHP